MGAPGDRLPLGRAGLSAAIDAGIPPDWIDAARRSPVYDLAIRYRVALPLHPEYRTMPTVWYIPPLSPVLDAVSEVDGDNVDPDQVFHGIQQLRIPMEYLASLFTAGDTEVVAGVLMKLSAMRGYMRARTLDGTVADDLLDATGMSGVDMEAMYRLLAIAKYDERYVIPPAHRETAEAFEELATGCSLDIAGGPGMGGEGRVLLPLSVIPTNQDGDR